MTEKDVPIRVDCERDFLQMDLRVRVAFRCNDGIVVIPFTLAEDELRYAKRPDVTINMTTKELKNRLLVSLQTMEAREILGA